MDRFLKSNKHSVGENQDNNTTSISGKSMEKRKYPKYHDKYWQFSLKSIEVNNEKKRVHENSGTTIYAIE